MSDKAPKHVVLMSGGIDSWAGVRFLKEKYEVDPVKMLAIHIEAIPEDYSIFPIVKAQAESVGVEIIRLFRPVSDSFKAKVSSTDSYFDRYVPFRNMNYIHTVVQYLIETRQPAKTISLFGVKHGGYPDTCAAFLKAMHEVYRQGYYDLYEELEMPIPLLVAPIIHIEKEELLAWILKSNWDEYMLINSVCCDASPSITHLARVWGKGCGKETCYGCEKRKQAYHRARSRNDDPCSIAEVFPSYAVEAYED